MSEIRVDSIVSETGTGNVAFNKGVTITGVVTTTETIVGSGVTINASGIDAVSGVVTATNFVGGGGLGTALSDDSTKLLSQIFVTPRSDIVAAGTSVSVESGVSGGGIAFTKLNRIDVGTGSTFHVGSGTTLIMNVLSVF